MTEVVRSGQWWFNHCGAASGNPVPEAEGSKVVEFQRKFAQYHGCQFGIACANGTAALEVALKALGIQPGDEVICPPYTFVATANAVLQVNGIPVFVDIDPDTYNIDPTKIEAAVTPRTKGIIPVHFGGQPADMATILKIAEKRGLFVLEDAAHAHGGKWRDKFCGSIGHAGTFSFQASKNMTAGEGGMVITNDRTLAERIESLVWCGRKHGHPWYEFFELGWNYRLTEFQAAILLCQLERLEEQTARRDENAQYLSRLLNAIPGIRPIERAPDTTIHTQHVYMIRYDSAGFGGLPRDLFLKALHAEGIPAIAGYTFSLFDNPMYREQRFWNSNFPIQSTQNPRPMDYHDYRKSCVVSERACKGEAVWLAQSIFLGTRQDMDDIASAFRKIHAYAGELALRT
ncbi:MAG: DegT/DnrJ/EryC1/StrS family aminotransferase [Planctomycetota bacterium]